MYCVKSVRIRSYSGLRFSRIRTEYGAYLSVFSPNAGKMRTRITPNTDTFYVVDVRGLVLVQNSIAVNLIGFKPVTCLIFEQK